MDRVHRLDASARASVLASLSEAISSHPDVSFALAFGSFMREEGFRDIDVAIWTPAESCTTIDVDLAAELSVRVGLPVDVRRLSDAPVAFLFHALRGAPLLVRDERLLADLRERTARQYHDLAPLLRRATREAFAA